MSRKTTTKALVVAAALAGAAFGVAPAEAVSTTITAVGPVKAGTTVATVITIKGTGFGDDIEKASFKGSGDACTADVILASATLLYAKKPASGCSEGKQVVKLLDGSDTPKELATFEPSDAKKTVTFAAPQDIKSLEAVKSGASVGGLHLGGTEIKVTVDTTTLSPVGLTATLGGKPITGIKVATDNKSFTGKAPAGTPGTAALVVTSDGVASKPFTAAGDAAWTYVRNVKISPTSMVKGNTAPVVKVESTGLKPAGEGATVKVLFGTVEATEITTGLGKPRTDSTMFVTAPEFPENAGPVTVFVEVDPDGAGDKPAVKSAVSSTSTFTYAAY